MEPPANFGAGVGFGPSFDTLTFFLYFDCKAALPQNVNYALKSSFVSAFLETAGEVASKLIAPHPPGGRKAEDAVKEAQGATALVLVY